MIDLEIAEAVNALLRELAGALPTRPDLQERALMMGAKLVSAAAEAALRHRERVAEGLERAKERGVQLGSPVLEKARAAKSIKSKVDRGQLRKQVMEALGDFEGTLDEKARVLNNKGVTTVWGKDWNKVNLSRLLSDSDPQ